MTDLKTLLQQHREQVGVGRLIVMYQIRTYAQQTQVQALLEEIGAIWDDTDLDVLIGAGMRGVLYYAVLNQKAKMAGIA